MESVIVAGSDERMRMFLCDNLEADGLGARAATGREHLLALARAEPPDALVLGELGQRPEALALLRELRAGETGIDPGLAVMVLSAQAGELEELRAFGAGADDFMATPFAYPVLWARLRALLGRARGRRDAVRVRLGRLEIDYARRLVRFGGTPVVLTALEFEFLWRLASDPERVFTKRELLRDVWGFRSEGRTRTIDAHAYRARRKLAAAGGDGLVVTQRGVGYCLRRPERAREQAA